MKIEITEAIGVELLSGNPYYFYYCFIDDVFMDKVSFTTPSTPCEIYDYFIKLVIREWQTKYRSKYNMNKITKQDMERLNSKTIVCEEIQNLDLTLKKANEFIRLQKIEGDF